MAGLLNSYLASVPFVGDVLTTPALVNPNVLSEELILTGPGMDVLHVPHTGFFFNMNTIVPPGVAKPSNWEEVAALSVPTSGAFTFSGLALAGYSRLEIYLSAIKTATAPTKLLVRLRYAGPTTMAHTYAIRNEAASDGSTSDANAASATDALLAGNAGTTYSMGNNAADGVTGLLAIDNPGSTLTKMLTWWGGNMQANGPDVLLLHSIARMTETNAVTEIVVLGNNALTAGKVTIMGLVK